MTKAVETRPADQWGGKTIPPGEGRDVQMVIGESYSGMSVKIPLHVRRGKKDGPVVFVTAALHGDEINGTGAVRALIQDDELQLTAGTLVLVPVLNMLGFDRHSRYLPDRRDLNRCFPGSAKGSLAGRMARVIFDEIVRRCDYGIDLHTAAVRRTNFPNVRGDLSNPEVERMTTAFGTEIVINGKGPKGAFRREACEVGCPTIVFEGGEVWKVEPTIVDWITRGVRNVLIELGMLDGKALPAKSQVAFDSTKWIRAECGGFLQFHVAPGDIIEKDQPLATNTSLIGREQNVLTSPFAAIVVGMTTLPAVSPGEPVCHLGKLSSSKRHRDRFREKLAAHRLHERAAGDLASNIVVVEPSDPN